MVENSEGAAEEDDDYESLPPHEPTPISDELLLQMDETATKATRGPYSYYIGSDAGVWCGHDCTVDGCLGHDLPCAVFEGPSRGCRESDDPSSRALEFALADQQIQDLLMTQPDAKHLANCSPENIRDLIARVRAAEAGIKDRRNLEQ